MKVTRTTDGISGMPTLELGCPKYWSKRDTINLIKEIDGVTIVKDRALISSVFEFEFFCEFELNGARFRVEKPDYGWVQIIHSGDSDAFYAEIEKLENSISNYADTTTPDSNYLRVMKLIYKFSLYGFIATLFIATIYLILTGEPLSI